MKQKLIVTNDSFPAMLSRNISICNTKTLYLMQVSHFDGFFCQLSIFDYNTKELIVDMVQHIEYIDSLVLTVDNLETTKILFGK